MSSLGPSMHRLLPAHGLDLHASGFQHCLGTRFSSSGSSVQGVLITAGLGNFQRVTSPLGL